MAFHCLNFLSGLPRACRFLSEAAMCTNKIVKNADLFSTHTSGKYNKENIGGFTMYNDE